MEVKNLFKKLIYYYLQENNIYYLSMSYPSCIMCKVNCHWLIKSINLV